VIDNSVIIVSNSSFRNQTIEHNQMINSCIFEVHGQSYLGIIDTEFINNSKKRYLIFS